MTDLITTEVREAVERSVLCWLATSDEAGQPNVSPKEIFAVLDDTTVVVANIASPTSSRNIRVNEKVCLSFIDIFVQKGFKVTGVAREVKARAADFSRWAEPLLEMAGERFPIHSVLVVSPTAVEPILAPSYRFYPAETTEESQIRSALRAYGVSREEHG
ncbi:pyridoxamine 5'-phosphate oxidase family protein [Halomonas sp. MCCC 1A11062]|uniref:pyridoxamine 5'-phosphate oxidase family protein n=1 Tax=Halomonas sp. MCCC 1A11062 TaxID=2733485 RepID=UPI001F29206F|nr:pyridoxamine 5'-phosphate oxidase family protein [Halomonas sp. MCCC 1A11062]